MASYNETTVNDEEMAAEGLYAFGHNEVFEGALLGIREACHRFNDKKLWGEVSIRFRDGKVISIEERKTRVI